MNIVIEFYLERCNSTHNFSLQDMWQLQKCVIGDGYFYIPWLFPVSESSKWNIEVPVFNQEDASFFRSHTEIQEKYLKSFDTIIGYFELVREGNTLKPTEVLQHRHYWLRNVGHESKKISRIIRSLALCGQPELAKNLQQTAIALGKSKGCASAEALRIWHGLL